MTFSPALERRQTRKEADALTVREVDNLVSKLLSEIKVPYASLGKRVLNQLSDLKRILSTNYLDDIALPPKPLLQKLLSVVETDIKQLIEREIKTITSGDSLADPHMLIHLTRIFGPREIELRAEPYREGAGLSLRGFFCRANMGQKAKFVIFLNTAHHPGAVAATLGHELGHYIYGSMVGEKRPMTYFMEGDFANHLGEEDELFADSLVAFGAYTRDFVKKIGAFSEIVPGSSEEAFSRIKVVYDLIGPRWNLDLKKGKMAAAWRVRYLTSMTHFFKLRCAIYQSAGL